MALIIEGEDKDETETINATVRPIQSVSIGGVLCCNDDRSEKEAGLQEIEEEIDWPTDGSVDISLTDVYVLSQHFKLKKQTNVQFIVRKIRSSCLDRSLHTVESFLLFHTINV